MPKSNVFNRTALFYRETAFQGRKRIRRIPWDLIQIDGVEGMFVSPIPISDDVFAEASTSSTFVDMYDMLYDEDQNDLIDEVVDIMWFESEADFISKFQGVFGFYISDAGKEFGYS